MPKLKNPPLTGSLYLCLSLLILSPVVYAQQGEIPPAPQADSESANSDSGRIVEGRPVLHGVKRALHPVAWLDFGLRPVFRTIDNFQFGGIGDDKEKAPRVAGIKYGIRGMGSGSGVGPEIKPFHYDLLGKGIEFEAPILVTYKLYQSAGVRTNFPFVRSESARFGVELSGRYTSRAADRFFGIGNDSDLANEVRFRSVNRTAGVALESRMAKNTWIARVGTAYRSVGITRPRRFRSVPEVFEPSDVAGLGEPGATMIVSTASLEHNTKDRVHLPSSGGLQRVEVSLNEGRTGGDFSFWRYRADLQQFFPLTDDKRSVIGFHGAVETNRPKGGSTIPFWDLPVLGSHSTVRGFQTRRFTDRSAINASLEYRYRIWRYFDWGIFADTGQVAPELKNLERKLFHTGYGMRFMVRAGEEAVSIAAARSREGWMFYVDFSPNF